MIHYHGTPMTPTKDMIEAFAGRHAMVSFAKPQQIEVAAEICQSVALDNGAFTAWTQGAPFDVDGFEDWARVWMMHPNVSWYLIPDVIDGSEEENDALISRFTGLRGGVPVWHLHESLDRLDRLVWDFPLIALGSSGEYKDPGSDPWWQRIAQAMGIICDSEGRPWVKTHGLRMLDPVLFSHMPLSSADSTNVARNSGIDDRWKGPYAPKSRAMRAQIMMDRIESHASAARWCGSNGVQHNLELMG